jgi:pyruvate/2-oxoglutarate dehydrogenase complex dihydrolipoamide acyltransferase (E2) component
MPDEKIDQKRPPHADSDLRKMQQRLVDDTVDDSFPASDPPAWTTTGAKSVAAKLDADSAPAPQDDTGHHATGGTARRVMDQATDLAREAYRHAGEYLEQGRGAGPYVRQAGQAFARPVQAYPVAALIAAGAVGYGLAWLIHRGTGRSTSSRPRGRGYNVAPHASPNTAHPEAADFDQPWPSGDSPKPHGDKLPNMVKIAPDNRDRY